MNCEFCGNIFKTNVTLLRHQQHAQYCVKLQGNATDIKKHVCEWCNKHFSRDDVLQNHLLICKNKHKASIENQNNKLREENEKLQKKYDKIYEEVCRLRLFKELYEKKDNDIITIAQRTTNIVVTGHLDLSEDRIKECVERSFNINHIYNGQRGVAEFAVNNLLKSNEGEILYECSDPSRNSYRYKGVSGEIVRDKGANKLTDTLYEPVNKAREIVTQNLTNECENDLNNGYTSIYDLNKDNNDFCKTLNRSLQK